MVWALVAINVMVAIWVKAVWQIDAASDLLAFAFSQFIFWPVLSVLALYFTGGVLPGVFGGKKSK